VRTRILIGLGAAVGGATSFAAEPTSVDRGQVVFEHWCVPCHGAGHARAGTIALQEKYHGAVPAELSKRTDLRPELIHYYLRSGVSIMPFFRKSEISPKEEQDLIAFLTRKSK
jgi:mono/diheme cytochrome c family protein